MTVLIKDNSYIVTGATGRTTFYPIGKYQYEMINEFESGDGKTTLETCREGIAYMFENTDALIIRGWIPSTNMAARQMATAFGATTKSKANGKIEKRITKARWRLFNAK